MEDLWVNVQAFLSSEHIFPYIRALIKVIVGLILGRVVSSSMVRTLQKRADAHHLMLLRRVSFYTVTGLFVASALMEVGFELSVLLGAAGILTVAIGFASQTSASNLISGLFLLGEKPFAIGDVIQVDTTTGEVLSIDLLSVKLRTFDNLYVRIANESLIKSQITNLTRFPIRRIDVQLGVAYKEDIRKVLSVLNEVADRNPLCLTEPAPLFIFLSYGDSALQFQYSVWGQREKFLDLKNGLMIEIKEAFDRHGIEIPFPHRTLYAGSVTEPFPIRTVSEPSTNGTAAPAP